MLDIIIKIFKYFQVESIVVGEDCALLSSNNDADDKIRIVGKRGLCGQLFMYKVGGLYVFIEDKIYPVKELHQCTQ